MTALGYRTRDFEHGYASIGCRSFARARQAGEEERAGRWWWELNEIKGCGVHRSDGRPRGGVG